MLRKTGYVKLKTNDNYLFSCRRSSISTPEFSTEPSAYSHDEHGLMSEEYPKATLAAIHKLCILSEFLIRSQHLQLLGKCAK